MARRRLLASIFLLVFVTDVRSQYFDFFGIPPLVQNYQTQKPRNAATTKRPRIESVQITNHRQEQTVKKITSVTYSVEEDESSSREKSRKGQNKQSVTLAPVNFNLYSTTAKPIRKTTKSSRKTTTKRSLDSQRLTSDFDLDDGYQGDRWFDRPVVNNINDFYQETPRPDFNNYDSIYNNQVTTKRPNHTTKRTTKNPYSRPNENRYTTKSPYNNQYTTKSPYSLQNQYTTKNPYYHRPGVKPAVPEIVENRPPITNRPITQRPIITRPTPRVTQRPVIIPAKPTDAGAISFPEDDVSPQIITGPDEDYMSDVEKRRYIEIAERMCDKYKSLNTKQLQAIPLLPSPDPVQVNVSSCAPVNIPLVVGGKVVRIEEFPHMALLGWLKLEGPGYSWKCGGSLISDQYVLTAAHCSFQERDNTVVTGPPRAVQLGSSYLDDSGALVVRVGAIVRHPKYKSPKSYYDVALLRLVHAVTFSQVIKPACLGVPPPVNMPIVATGWGRTEFSDQSLELRSVSLPIWDMNKCAGVLGTSRKLPDGPSSDSQLCAGEMRGGRDTCQGDSGGPAQIQDGCIWRVVGVTSLGRSCGAPNTPGLYARVPRAFIAAQAFGGWKTNARQTTTTEINYQNNEQGYQQGHNSQQGYNSQQGHNNQQAYNSQQGYDSQQTYNRPTTERNQQNYDQNYYNSDNYNNNHRQNNQNNNQGSRRDYRNDQNSDSRNNNYYNNENYETSSERNHRNVDVKNDNVQYDQNDRNYNTDYNGRQTYDFNNHKRNYRDDHNENYDNNYRDIADSSRIWFT